jgi:hypothetical protein
VTTDLSDNILPPTGTNEKQCFIQEKKVIDLPHRGCNQKEKVMD